MSVEVAMARVSYREVQDRFTHINAKLVGCQLGFPDEGSYFAVQFYPSWEHPRCAEALRKGENWGFTDAIKEAAKEVRVYPVGLIAFRISYSPDVVNWDFVESGPLLWPYEEEGTMFVNSRADASAVVSIVTQELGRARSLHSHLAELATTLAQSPPVWPRAAAVVVRRHAASAGEARCLPLGDARSGRARTPPGSPH